MPGPLGRIHHDIALVVLACSASLACEHHEDCGPIVDAGALATANQDGRCISSRFPMEDTLAREISGRVRDGLELVPGATVRLDPSGGLGDDARFDGGTASMVTDEHGLYRFNQANGAAGVPTRYDLSILRDREVFAFRGLTFRYLEPSIGEGAPPRAFTGKLDVTLAPPPAAGDAVAFFVDGDDAVSATGTDPRDVSVQFRQFSQKLRLHVVEYPLAKGLAAAAAYGTRDDVYVEANATKTTTIVMAAIAGKANDVVVDGSAPPGAAPSPASITIDFGIRTNDAIVATTPLGAHVTLAAIPDAHWAVRFTASLAGATLDSGRFYFDPAQPVKPIAYPAPELVAPAEGQAGALVATATGPREHVLAPLEGQPFTLRVVTVDASPSLPDLGKLGLPAPRGRYAWTVRHWPTLLDTRDVAGLDARVRPAQSVSAPRAIVVP